MSEFEDICKKKDNKLLMKISMKKITMLNLIMPKNYYILLFFLVKDSIN